MKGLLLDWLAKVKSPLLARVKARLHFPEPTASTGKNKKRGSRYLLAALISKAEGKQGFLPSFMLRRSIY